MSDNSNNQNALTTYDVNKRIPPCEVDIDLLQKIEDFIFEKVSEHDKNPEEDYEVTIFDKFGFEKLKSIKQNRSPFFPDGVNLVKLEYGRFTRDNIGIELSIYPRNNQIHVSIKSKAARREVEGYIAEFMQIIHEYKTSRFYNPPIFVIIFLFAFSIFYMFLLYLGIIEVIFIPSFIRTATSIFVLSYTIYLLFTSLTPYVIFPTRRNQNLEKWRSWIMFAVLEFVIFAIFGGYFLSKILGI